MALVLTPDRAVAQGETPLADHADAIDRTIPSKLKERSSLKDWTVDDTGVTSINAVLAKAAAAGVDIEIPEGKYLVDDDIALEVKIKCRHGSRIKVANAKILDFAGGVDIHPKQIAFDASAGGRYKFHQWVSPCWFGASGQGQITTTGGISASTTSLVVADADTWEVGNGIAIAGAGVAGATLITRVTAVSGTTLTVADTASTTVAGAVVSHDDTAAFAKAILACELSKSGLAHTYPDTQLGWSFISQLGPQLRIPPGEYRVSSALVVGGGTEWVGERCTIIGTDADENVISLTQSGPHVFHSISFGGGKNCIYANMNWDGEAWVNFFDCEFVDGREACIYTDIGCANTGFFLRNCHFVPGLSYEGVCGIIKSSDYFVVDQPYMMGFSGRTTAGAMWVLGDEKVGRPWAPTTAFTAGEDWCMNDSPAKHYKCVQSGTSAGSGGPTGTSTGIVDGTVIWDYHALAYGEDGLCSFAMSNMLGGPGSNNVPNQKWIEVRHASKVSIDRCRFGGEAGGWFGIYNTQHNKYLWDVGKLGSLLGDISIGNSPMYASDDAGVYLECLPKALRVLNCEGSGHGIEFGSSITASEIDVFFRYGGVVTDYIHPVWRTEHNNYSYYENAFSSHITTKTGSLTAIGAALAINEGEYTAEYLQPSDLLWSGTATDFASFGPDTTYSASVTGSNPNTGPYARILAAFSSAADDQSANYGAYNILRACSGITANQLITLSIYVRNSHPMELSLGVGLNVKTKTIPAGKRMLNVPFSVPSDWDDANANRKVFWSVANVQNGVSWDVGDLRVYNGWRNPQSLAIELYAAAIPSAATFTAGKFQIGDRVINTASTAGVGTPAYWRCTTAGRYAPVWVALTAYKIGNIVRNDTSRIYVCTTAGTSAGSGGPTGTGSGITDGTVTWNYVEAIPAWTASGYGLAWVDADEVSLKGADAEPSGLKVNRLKATPKTLDTETIVQAEYPVDSAIKLRRAWNTAQVLVTGGTGGSSANVDLELVPAGTGKLKLPATATSSVATASTHKIEVKDGAGNIYYLLATT